jgi:hypothetical protein
VRGALSDADLVGQIAQPQIWPSRQRSQRQQVVGE